MVSLRITYLGDKYWSLNNLPHRANGPAFYCTDGTIDWFVNGRRHRVDGPAQHLKGVNYWFINDVKLSEYEIMFLQLSK